MPGPRRLIEVDLPIREISAHARREKSIRHGHISTLHIWWARRPLAACRAVVMAALLPDPADPECPEAFREGAARALRAFRDRAGGSPVDDTPEGLRRGILDFIAKFAAWEASTEPVFLDCARALVAAAYPDGPPLVVDPFAGGGAIPMEALRVGADAWACDYNPVAALLLKVVLEDMPRYGDRLAEGVRQWGAWVKERVERDIGRFYPPDPDGAVPIAYLWARTITCEGPGCGAEVPLLRQLWLARKAGRRVALQLRVDRKAKRVTFEIDEDPKQVGEGTVRRGSATCPVCGYVTPVARVRAQATARGGLPVRMVAVVRAYPERQGRYYRAATERDVEVAERAEQELRRREREHAGALSLVPDEPLPPDGTLGFRVQKYGVRTWGDLFLPRQALALTSFAVAVREVYEKVSTETGDTSYARGVASCLALAVDRQADLLSALVRWLPLEAHASTFSRQALPMVWDFAEACPLSGATGSWDSAVSWIEKFCLHVGASRLSQGQAVQGDARALQLSDASAAGVVTDPPYYDAVPYADLSDFFYVWLRRSLGHVHPALFSRALTAKYGEIVVNPTVVVEGGGTKDKAFFELEMQRALAEARRVLSPGGIATVVFAHKTTAGWEAMLQALLDAGWAVTGSWPVDTERPGRLREQNSAALASSVHIVCRPRAMPAQNGQWRHVRAELEHRVAEWLPRLQKEGIEGADAIFACLGPAVEVYSRYGRVETAAGDVVPLSPPRHHPDVPAFLPAVWTAIAKEALRMLFEGPEAEGLEEDARLTALWLWTLRSARNGQGNGEQDDVDTEEDDDAATRSKAVRGFTLDYDTARKLAQALGAHLEDLTGPRGVIELKGATARLLGVAERRRVLFGAETKRERAGPKSVGTLFDPAELAPAVGPSGSVLVGRTHLDRLHQAMLIFADGHGDRLRRFLAEVADERLRRLARTLHALYPAASAERRWLEGVLQRLRLGA